MGESLARELREQIRGITGGLLVVGLAFHYTMETWWLGWTLPLPYLVAYAIVGLTLVVVVTRRVGFHEEEPEGENKRDRWYIGLAFAEILLQSFIASYVMLLVLGIIDLNSSPNLVMRLGLIEVVPLGFGAAMANRVFGGNGEEAEHEGEFPRNVAIFAIGALFIASPIAPTQEIELIAVHMDWLRYGLLIALTLVLVYLILFELHFKGQSARVTPDRRFQVGTTFIVYFVGATVSFLLLLGFGHFDNGGLSLWYQATVILAFPASLGAAAAEVII
jgi:putative integral membrane protein (TIGR02587 family)